MILDFDKIEGKYVENMKGGEGGVTTRRYEDDEVVVLKNTMDPGASVGFHTHHGDYEVIYVLEGEGTVQEDDQMKPIKAGQVNYCAEGCSHSLINSSDKPLTIVAVLPKTGK